MISNILSTDYIPTESNINGALEYVMNVFKKKSLLFLFSDFNDEISDNTLQIAAKKHQLLGIRVFDEKDNEIPNIGYAEFQDIETGKRIWVNTSDARFRYQFTEQKKQNLKNTEQLFRKSSAGFINIGAENDYAKELYGYFKGS